MDAPIDDEWEEWNGKGSFFDHMFAGSCAGVAEHVAMFPVDTYKTHCQVHTDKRMSFWQMVRQYGVARMWRGAPAMFVACIPSHAAYFSVYEASKASFGVDQPGHHPFAAASAGSLATIIHDAVLTPMDVVKQRLQLGYYKGIFDCVKTMMVDEGLRAFYRSYPTTVVMNIPYAAVVVATNESLKELLNPEREHSMGSYLVAGAGAGAAAALVTNPLDVVKTRLQTQRCSTPVVRDTRVEARVRGVITGPRPPPHLVANMYTSTASPEYYGLWDTAKKVYAEDGLLGFTRGIRARMLVHTPSMAISWSTYEFVKYCLAGDQ